MQYRFDSYTRRYEIESVATEDISELDSRRKWVNAIKIWLRETVRSDVAMKVKRSD